jgi:SSS family solute:Na+ symporter
VPLCLLATTTASRLISLSWVDLAIIAIYFGAVLAIGFYLKARVSTGEDFFLAGREMTAWGAGLIAGFMSGNVSAFATVWTYDIYRAYLKRAAALRNSMEGLPWQRKSHLG